MAATLPAVSQQIKIATFNAELVRKGPGLLLRGILSGKDKQVNAVISVISEVNPDVLLITGFDYDLEAVALRALIERLDGRGASYPFFFAARPNTGMPTGMDMDGDGRLGGPGDAQGFGGFAGQGGMAVLSRLPIDADQVRDFSAFLWRDLPDNLIDGAALSTDAQSVQRLSTTAHWAVPVVMPGGMSLQLLAYHASPPVFDGPEDRNGRRSHDETVFWSRLIDGDLPWSAPGGPFVVIGDANMDPADGDGRRRAITSLLSDVRLQDPRPRGDGGRAAVVGNGAVSNQNGDPALDTVDWPEGNGPGNLRVDYVLPSADLKVVNAGIWWPQSGAWADVAASASRHRLVWVEIDWP